MIKRLPLPILHFYIGVSVCFFLGIEYLKAADYTAPDWIFHYGNDFLCIPIVSFIALRSIWLLKKNQKVRIPFSGVFALIVIFSIYFEVYLPRMVSRYTGDWKDVICYLLGGLIFYGLQHADRWRRIDWNVYFSLDWGSGARVE